MNVIVATPVDLGAMVREARERRGWTQTELGTRIGASRFWVAAFERGKPGAELGLALCAAAAVGLRLRAERPARPARRVSARPDVGVGAALTAAETTSRHDILSVDLDEIVGDAPRTVRPASPGA